ncbi:hypothetical protein AWH48_16625 [Domibacillus aminovorans]|uniref:DUF4359 domain-containing protein n=1 Tax=Domibacillus aminovorans TaxID=29332 RepID=A0A177KZP6_9BACI|nr:DUF4359 domain-containing protein [Domibacillus aminovorans]OAH58626.1 hypothetical protein AWH48_16625 [Domibacillus aminovorans]
MKKKYIAFIVFGFIFGIMVLSNPSKDDFVSWSKEEIMKDTNGLVGLGIKMFGDPLINNATESSNYLVFSVYKTKISEEETFKTVGLFNNFIPIPTKVNDERSVK